ncbi:MAG: AMP-binding protein, partial [Planctomycetes bacterium]|nr:AMP-binding protein [Planctomycetota bacterium]
MIASAYPKQRRIAERLAGQEIFVTGATGFLAKVFVEKLLRCVSGLGKIHLLIRPGSDGHSAEQRAVRELFGSSAFERLRASLGPGFERLCREKINVVSGDLTLERFGLSQDDYDALARRVTLVVNSAATVTFDEQLDVAIALNIAGAQRLLEFARDAGNAPMLHVSTAYVSGVRQGDIPETILSDGHTVASYIASRDPNNGLPEQGPMDLDDALQTLRDLVVQANHRYADRRSARRQELIRVGMEYSQKRGWNDTYTFTKWLAEQLLARDRGDVPLVLYRPAIIESSYDEPAPGWIDGLRMADPLILVFGRGKLTEFPALPDAELDLIPVDLVANGMIATLPVGRSSPSLQVFHCSSSARNPVLLRVLLEYVGEAFRRRPMRDAKGRPIRIPNPGLANKERFVKKWESRLRRTRRLRSLLKSRSFAQRLRKRLASLEAQINQLLYFTNIYSPYTHLKCRYRDDRLRAVYEALDAEDREEFPCDPARIDWRDYIVNRHVPGVRHFVLGSGMELEAPMLAAHEAVADEAPDAPPPMQVLAALRGASIYEVFENAAKTYPSRIVLQVRREGRWVRYSYADALATTAAIARRFAEYGLTHGDHIGLISENCPEWGLTYLAAMRCGLTVVPLDVQLPPGEAVAMARFADVRLICTGHSNFEALQAAVNEENPDRSIDIVKLDRRFVPPPGASRDPGPDPVAVTDDEIASIVFTSGTTLAPKGVMLRHRNFLANARSLVHAQPIHSNDQFLSVLPLHHVFEFTGGFLVPIAYAATVTYVEQLSGPEIVSTMQATGTTVMMVVPKLLKAFHDAIVNRVENSGRLTRLLFRVIGRLSDWSGGRLGPMLFDRVHKQFGGRLRMFVCGGSALPVWLFQAFERMGLPVYEGFGLTETAPVITVSPVGAARAGSVGLPLPEIELDIRNQDSRGVGELWVRGPTVMAGYYKNEAATREMIVEGWLRTGDLCRCDADGFLYVTGRVKDIIVSAAGKNVYPDEVEVYYAGLPHVKELCVLAMPNRDGIGDSVDAVMVLDLESVADVDRSAIEAEVRRAVAQRSERIPSYQRIQNIHFWTSDLPKTATLKAKRNLIAGQLAAHEQPGESDHQRAEISPTAGGSASFERVSANEAWVRELLARLTMRPPSMILPESNLLLDLGVDSLMKIQVFSEMETHFGVELSDQISARVGRVSDLVAVIGQR